MRTFASWRLAGPDPGAAEGSTRGGRAAAARARDRCPQRVFRARVYRVYRNGRIFALSGILLYRMCTEDELMARRPSDPDGSERREHRTRARTNDGATRPRRWLRKRLRACRREAAGRVGRPREGACARVRAGVAAICSPDAGASVCVRAGVAAICSPDAGASVCVRAGGRLRGVWAGGEGRTHIRYNRIRRPSKSAPNGYTSALARLGCAGGRRSGGARMTRGARMHSAAALGRRAAGSLRPRAAHSRAAARETRAPPPATQAPARPGWRARWAG